MQTDPSRKLLLQIVSAAINNLTLNNNHRRVFRVDRCAAPLHDPWRFQITTPNRDSRNLDVTVRTRNMSLISLLWL